MWRLLLCASSILVSFFVSGQIRHFVAPLEQSYWTLSDNTPLKCQLEHDIPAYGRAVFTTTAGKDHNLLFNLDMWIKPDLVTQAQLISLAPTWRPGVTSKQITQLTYQKYFNGEVPRNAAWTMLAELDRGMQPTFYYADWYDRRNQIAVGLSSVNFSRNYNEFKSCIANLLPYSFDDIAFTVLTFESGGSELTITAKKQIERVKEYLTYAAEDVDSILIDAYTDSYGGRSVNRKVSEKRADAIKQILISAGISQDRIRAVGHGESRHVAANNTIDERGRNRRVVIRINKLY